MRFIVLTPSPDMTRQGLSTSIPGRAEEQGSISLGTWSIRDYTTERHGHMDDVSYDGDAGAFMQTDPILRCHRSAAAGLPKAPWVIYVTSQGRQFTQVDAKMLTAKEIPLILCGHYEGVGERILELLGVEPYSIGDYVPTGGELPIMAMVDTISRMVPNVFSSQGSDEIESLGGSLLEYPQYIRPEAYKGPCVPLVLLSGGHKKVAQWRQEQILLQARKRRPDLFIKVKLNEVSRKFLQAQVERGADESRRTVCETGRSMLDW